MSKGSADRRGDERSRRSATLLFAVLIIGAACDARPTGTDDVLAITRHRPTDPHSARVDAGRADAGLTDHEPTDNDGEPESEPDSGANAGGGSGKSAAGSGGRAGRDSAAGAGGTAEPPLPPAAVSDDEDETPRKPVLFWVDVLGNRVYRANADGTARQVMASAQTIAAPDGVTVDLTDGFVYWTNMGAPLGGANTGTLQRMKLGAETVETVIPIGTTNTPKQISIDDDARKLYWCDREGGKVWRASLDGSDPEILVSGHGIWQPVGMGLDVAKRQFYFSDRMARRIYRANFDLPEGQTAENRDDVETLFSFAVAAMPLDLDLDLEQRKIYWTDRIRGTISRANMDMAPGTKPEARPDTETLVDGLLEPIGVSLDRVEKKLYFTQLAGEVSRVDLDGTHMELVVSTGSASGVTLAHLPTSTTRVTK